MSLQENNVVSLRPEQDRFEEFWDRTPANNKLDPFGLLFVIVFIGLCCWLGWRAGGR